MESRAYYHKLDLRKEVARRLRGHLVPIESLVKAILVGTTLFVLLLATSGCHQLRRQGESGNYETVRAEPNRDVAEARRLNEKAIEYISEQRWDKAIETLEKALAADVTFGPAHNNLGRVYYAQRKYYLAAWELQHAINEMPGHIEPINNLGLVYEAVGRFGEAIEQYETAFALAPTNAEVMGNLARARLAHDPKDPAVQDILRELVFYDTRPHWVGWAREQLALRGTERLAWNNNGSTFDPGEDEVLSEESREFIPSPAPVWGGEADYELVPPSNQPPMPGDAGSHLKRSPISQAAIWRLPADSNSPASSIPSTFETGGIRPVVGYSSRWQEELEVRPRNAHRSNSKID